MGNREDSRKILIKGTCPWEGYNIYYTAKAIDYPKVLEGFEIQALETSKGHYTLLESHWKNERGKDDLGPDWNKFNIGSVNSKFWLRRKMRKEIRARANDLAKNHGIKNIVDESKDLIINSPSLRYLGCGYK